MSDVTRYRVIGPCEVAGVPPGEIVTRAQLQAWSADVNIDALLGPHLEQVAGQAAKAKEQLQKAAKP